MEVIYTREMLKLPSPPQGPRPRPVVATVDDNDCHICTSHCLRTPNNYPTISVSGSDYSICRVVYERFVGPIAEGLVIRHTCDNRRCINPHHLTTGTYKQNTQDMVRRGRHCPGSSNGNSRLTDAEAFEIKGLRGETQRSIARRYGVSKRTIHNIQHGFTWKHI